MNSIPVSKIVPSQTNPRKYFDPASLAELTDSVRRHGVLQPILVRPLKGSSWIVDEVVQHGRKKQQFYQVLDRNLIKDGAYTGPELRFETKVEAEANIPEWELVCGERRWRAAKGAGLAELPAVVRELTDKESLEVAVIENLQRADLQPMEEAEGYELLMDKHGYAADDIAAKVGKSKAYVYSRLKLTALCPAARECLSKGELTPSIALLVARIPHAELQEEAIKEVCLDFDGEPVSYRVAAQEIQRLYMLRLKEAPFNIKDAKLVPEAGACATCPKRTGNQKDLFADVDSADVCTDPKCFAAKRQAHAKQAVEKAKANGQTVLEAKEAFDNYGYVRNSFVKLNDRCNIGSCWDSTWKKKLGKAAPAPVLAVDKDGNVQEVIRRDDAIAALKSAGKLDEAEDGGVPKVDRKAELREQKIQRLYEWKVTEAILNDVVLPEVQTVRPEVWKFLALNAFNQTDITKHSEVAKRRGLARTQNEARPALEAWLDDPAREPRDYVGMTVELLCCANPWNEDRWTELCRVAGVDLLALQKEAKAEAK